VERCGDLLQLTFRVQGVAGGPLALHWCASVRVRGAPGPGTEVCACGFSFSPVCRGLYRESTDTWQRLPELPAGSVFEPASGGTRTALSDDGSGVHCARLSVPADFAPASLAFTLAPAAAGSPPQLQLGRAGGANGVSGRPFCVPLGHAPGSPSPLGASLAHPATPTAVPAAQAVLNLALLSRGATGVTLYLQWGGGDGADEEGELELALDPALNRTGDTWHVALPLGGPACALPGLATGLLYGWRCGGGGTGEGIARGERFHLGRVLFDPHARALLQPLFAPPAPPGVPPPPLLAALGHLAGKPFAWPEDGHEGATQGSASQQAAAAAAARPAPPAPARSALVAYLLDVRRFTGHPSSGCPASQRGTFLGALSRVEHLLALGVNCVLLAPCHARLPGQHAEDAAPAGFFALDGRLASHPARAQDEFRALVAGLHAAGILVLPSFGLSHTCERVSGQPVSLAGLDAPSYYLVNADGSLQPAAAAADAHAAALAAQAAPGAAAAAQPVVPHAALNPCAAAVQNLVLDALRYWRASYRVDGFLLLGAAAAARGPQGRSPMLEGIALDAVVGGPHSLLFFANEAPQQAAGAAQQSQQPVMLPHWSVVGERVASYPSDCAAFAHGRPGALSQLATRLCGSGDALAPLRNPTHALNVLTGLAAGQGRAVSLAQTAFSPDAGTGGAGGDDDAVRARVMLLILFVSAGVPVLTMGDEFGDAKQPQPPAAGAGDEHSPAALRWDVDASPWGASLAAFVAACAAARRQHAALLSPVVFPSDGDRGWSDALLGRPAWEDAEAPALLAFRAPAEGPRLFVALNASGVQTSFALPPPPAGHVWRVLLDAAAPPPADCTPRTLPPEATSVTVPSPGAVLLECRPAAGTPPDAPLSPPTAQTPWTPKRAPAAVAQAAGSAGAAALGEVMAPPSAKSSATKSVKAAAPVVPLPPPPPPLPPPSVGSATEQALAAAAAAARAAEAAAAAAKSGKKAAPAPAPGVLTAAQKMALGSFAKPTDKDN